MVTTRPGELEDEPFLYILYGSTRQEEFALWGLAQAQVEPLLQMQFRAQNQAYGWPERRGDHQIICHGDQPIGRIVVRESEQALHLVDISLMPEYRGLGIGGGLIRDLLDRAAATNRVARLNVRHGNVGARRLYERLGFVVSESTETDATMEWRPEGN